ncbi:PASTA domain-containing protein [Micromonospora sp. AP08]|uniref:PASTA domain-containing protein n=1 Tax=Micromonospora sp. AP08 TaxID=2604467 RepID=UPI0016522DB6|nr:PASTA domain-containing protein [Micromonospora sp. AP08]
MGKNEDPGRAAWVVVAVLVGLFLAPVIGAVWGLSVVATWLLRRGSEHAPSTARALGAGFVALASVAFGAAVYPAVFAEQETTRASALQVATSSAPSPTPSTSPSTFALPIVPDAVGSEPYAAASLIRGAGLRSTLQDASPLDRHVYVEKNWTVVATEPPAGSPVAPGSEVTVLVLKNEEAVWFTAHPKMPSLSKGKPADTLVQPKGALAGMSELVLFRYAKGQAPKYASDPVDKYLIDGWEPAEETKARAGLKQAYEFSSVTVGSIPSAGQSLRVGRLIVVTVKQAPRTSRPYGNDGGQLPSRPHNDDDDFNVPGWLCPTRFC